MKTSGDRIRAEEAMRSLANKIGRKGQYLGPPRSSAIGKEGRKGRRKLGGAPVYIGEASPPRPPLTNEQHPTFELVIVPISLGIY